MDACPSPWFAELGMEMGTLDFVDQQFLDEFLVGEFPQGSSSSSVSPALPTPTDGLDPQLTGEATTVPKAQSSTTSSPAERPVKVRRTINASSPCVAANLSNVDSASAGGDTQVVGGFDGGSSGAREGPKRVVGTETTTAAADAAAVLTVPVAAAAKTPGQALYHIMAERRRREKLSQRFIALCAIVPGLTRMDKASVLTNAIKYVKELQERVKFLEEQALKKSACESVVVVNKSQLHVTDESNSYSTEESKTGFEIEVKLSDRSIIVKIHCENQKGFLAKALSEMEKFPLLIASMSVLPITDSTIDITIIAQMEEEFLSVKELIMILRSTFNEFI